MDEERLKHLRDRWSRGYFYLSDGAEVLDEIDRLLARIKELEDSILETCKYSCTGREAYRGKLRHEANCLAWAMDIGLDAAKGTKP